MPAQLTKKSTQQLQSPSDALARSAESPNSAPGPERHTGTSKSSVPALSASSIAAQRKWNETPLNAKKHFGAKGFGYLPAVPAATRGLSGQNDYELRRQFRMHGNAKVSKSAATHTAKKLATNDAMTYPEAMRRMRGQRAANVCQDGRVRAKKGVLLNQGPSRLGRLCDRLGITAARNVLGCAATSEKQAMEVVALETTTRFLNKRSEREAKAFEDKQQKYYDDLSAAPRTGVNAAGQNFYSLCDQGAPVFSDNCGEMTAAKRKELLDLKMKQGGLLEEK